jgi:hypothetical protein
LILGERTWSLSNCPLEAGNQRYEGRFAQTKRNVSLHG